jgi:hypothetical protein
MRSRRGMWYLLKELGARNRRGFLGFAVGWLNLGGCCFVQHLVSRRLTTTVQMLLSHL